MEPPQSSNDPSDEWRIPWETFVRMVLDVTISGYQKLRQDGVARRDWEEDTFTINLVDHIRPYAFLLLLHVIPQAPVYTDQMKTGEVTPRKAKVIDMQLFGNWRDYHKIHFVWECKKVTDKRVDKGDASLIGEYVTNGMFRFLDAKYAAEVPDAGMLGYVLAGDVSNIVSDINTSMCSPQRKRRLAPSDNLSPTSSIGSFTDVYLSHHKRLTNGSPIHLRHLFLTFHFS